MLGKLKKTTVVFLFFTDFTGYRLVGGMEKQILSAVRYCLYIEY